MKKGLTITIILGILLIFAIGYIIVDEYQEKKQKEQTETYQEGAQYGYEQAMIQIIQQAVTCQQVPLTIENQTINIVAVGCLQQG